MEIQKSKNYEKDYKKKIVHLHKNEEKERIEQIETIIMYSENMKKLLMNPLSIIFGIEQKKGNLKEYYTADINKKLRLYMKPIGEYPYNTINIDIIRFEKIDDKHYGDG